MPIKDAGYFQEQLALTNSTAAADRTVLLSPRKSLTAELVLVSGTPTTGARLQYTNDPEDRIVAGTAQWINSPNGYTVVSRGEGSPSSACSMTGVRAEVADASVTWNLSVRQAA